MDTIIKTFDAPTMELKRHAYQVMKNDCGVEAAIKDAETYLRWLVSPLNLVPPPEPQSSASVLQPEGNEQKAQNEPLVLAPTLPLSDLKG